MYIQVESWKLLRVHRKQLLCDLIHGITCLLICLPPEYTVIILLLCSGENPLSCLFSKGLISSSLTIFIHQITSRGLRLYTVLTLVSLCEELHVMWIVCHFNITYNADFYSLRLLLSCSACHCLTGRTTLKYTHSFPLSASVSCHHEHRQAGAPGACSDGSAVIR